MVNKVTWQKAGRVTEPGRYMFRFGWLTVTADDLAIWRQFPDAAFTLVRCRRPPTRPRNFISAPLIRRPVESLARRALTEVPLFVRLQDPPPTASHRRRAATTRGAGGWRPPRPRRPPPATTAVDPARLDRLDGKSVAASPQRHRALPPQPFGIDDGRARSRRRRPRVTISAARSQSSASASGRSASATSAAAGRLRHAAAVVA